MGSGFPDAPNFLPCGGARSVTAELRRKRADSARTEGLYLTLCVMPGLHVPHAMRRKAMAAFMFLRLILLCLCRILCIRIPGSRWVLSHLPQDDLAQARQTSTFRPLWARRGSPCRQRILLFARCTYVMELRGLCAWLFVLRRRRFPPSANLPSTLGAGFSRRGGLLRYPLFLAFPIGTNGTVSWVFTSSRRDPGGPAHHRTRSNPGTWFGLLRFCANT